MAKKHSQKTIFFSYKDFTDNRNLLDNIIVPKKYQHTLDKIKTGTFTKGITDTEKKLMDENSKFQLDVFNTPTNDSYQKELSRTTKRIAKISGLNEIEERLGVLKMVKLISFDDFEASVKHLNDARKEIELKIRSLKEETVKNSTQRRLIAEKIGELEKDRDKIVESIMNAPERENYLKRKKLLEERIEKYHEQIYRFCLDFVEGVNKNLTPIREKKGFSEFYLDYDLTFAIQKKEKHENVVDGKVHTANIKAYKFEQLDRGTKVEVLKTIKANFKKEYLKDDI